MLRTLRLLAVTLRAEGLRAVVDRALDHRRYRRRGRAALLPAAGLAPAALRSATLHLLANPPRPWLGGVEAQLAVRRRQARAAAPFALAYREAGGLVLEVQERSQSRTWRLPATVDGAGSLSAGLTRAAAFVGAERVAVENLAGLPFGELLALRQGGLQLRLRCHDFAAFCRRPHLMDSGSASFCGYSTDLERCGRCLGALPAVQAEYRRQAAALLDAADELSFASEFLRRRLSELYELPPGVPQLVEPPAWEPPARLPARRPRQGPLRLAFVGSAGPHKGSRVFLALLAALAPEERRRLRFFAFGGGEPAELLAFRWAGVTVRGYYRFGSLPHRLRRAGIDLALLLSVMAETHCLVLDECRAAGVPVLAFDHGALGERVRTGGGGQLAAPVGDVAALLAALRQWVASAGTGSAPAP